MQPVLTTHLESKTGRNSRRHELGQFLTSDCVADFMASMFTLKGKNLDLLDAGAGASSLTAALIRRICQARSKPRKISVTAYELDAAILDRLNNTMAECDRLCKEAGIAFTANVIHDDFVLSTIPTLRGDFLAPPIKTFNAAIVNPPYKKIRSESTERRLLSLAGIETSNLYTAFIEIIMRLLAPGGELVAITPRSFCNGPYFKPFRLDFLKMMNLRRIHVFESRSSAFKTEGVLQENIIYHAVKGGDQPETVTLSTSSGNPGDAVTEYPVDYGRIISANDPEKYIHLSMDAVQARVKDKMSGLQSSLSALGLTVSTGRVVDFRAKDFLCKDPEKRTAPLIYPCHFSWDYVAWPKANIRKPNAILDCESTHDLLVPAGVYVLVRRFSSKEERRRIVACIYQPERIAGKWVGFENHLNYFHFNGQGMGLDLAKGLFAFLNSSMVDQYFRQFSGHTQVNAMDLRKIPYPPKSKLEALGRKLANLNMSQGELDQRVEKELF